MFLDAHVQIATIFVSVLKLKATMKKNRASSFMYVCVLNTCQMKQHCLEV